MDSHRKRAAFFDVDDTLITIKSMFHFLEYDVTTRRRPPSDYQGAMDELRALRAVGAPRVETNRVFYRNFAGRDVNELAARGVEWFQTVYARGGLFNQRVLSALRQHSLAGDLVVLVSGSFPACLNPIARFVGADLLLCSRPEIRDGRYTGELAVPIIGDRKADVVRAEAAGQGIDLEQSHAYGDHLSDLPLLNVVGHPVAVGDDPSLSYHAILNGWPWWPGPKARPPHPDWRPSS